MIRLLKWPLLVAVLVVIGRVVMEQAGLPDSFNNILSAVALHAVIAPVYFAIRIATSGVPNPYATQFKLTGIYVVLVRAMLLPTYWLARIYQWHQPRFYGLTDSTSLVGYVFIPFGTAAFWIVTSLVFGGLLGCVIIAIVRRFRG